MSQFTAPQYDRPNSYPEAATAPYSVPYSIWYEGVRILPPLPPAGNRETQSVIVQDALHNEPVPRNRAERRAFEAQRRRR